MSLTALIPARSGSQRIPNKNIKELAGHPLIAYTIQAAKNSGLFDRIICSTDSNKIKEAALHYGADVPFFRRKEHNDGAHFCWIMDFVYRLALDRQGNTFVLLFPTNPFRAGETIKKAVLAFAADEKATSLLSMRKITEHPAKMRVKLKEHRYMLPFEATSERNYNLPIQELRQDIYIQNANFRIFNFNTLLKYGDELGDNILGYQTTMPEALDINDEYDWFLAEILIEKGLAKLPEIQ